MKKKLLLTLLTVILGIFAIGTFTVSAKTYGYLTYTVSNGKVTITDCSRSASGPLTIPDTIDGYPVTAIGDYAFFDCDSLSSITIPDSVTSIGDSAFERCDSLSSITIGDSVTSIGDYAFFCCDSLTSVTIPDSVTSIGDYAFAGCKSLASINVDINNQNYSSIDGNLYNKNKTTLIQYAIGKNDTLFTIPDSVTSIGDYAFAGCDISSITIPDSVTSIGDDAFAGCESLSDVYYTGTEEEWFNIRIGSKNTALTNATRHYNTRIVKLYNSDNNIVKTIPVKPGELIDISDLELEGYVLKIYLDAERRQEFDYTTPVYENLDLYITYEELPEYTYTFLDEDGTVIKNVTAYYGTIITAPEIADKDPYTFDYWQGYSEGMELTQDITFTAVYKYKSYSIFAEGISGSTTVTYNSDFTLSTQQKNEYIFKGYYTERNGLGTQITDENGNSTKVYNIVGNLSVYPYFESAYMNKLVLSGEATAEIGDTVLQRLSFATNSDAMYLTLTIKYPAFLNYIGKTEIDFIETYIDAQRTDGEYNYIDMTCVYDYNGSNIPKNKKITPFELEFEVPHSAPVGNVQITAENVMLDGAETVYITDIIAGKMEIMPKLAESIRILVDSTIDKVTQLSAEVLPEYTTNKTVAWSVSDESVAQVTEDGILTPLKNGEITITASATDGSGIIATKTVSIIAYAKISALDFGIGISDVKFNPDVRDYTVYVGGDATSIWLTPEFSGGVLRPNGSGIWISGRAREFVLSETEPTVITLCRQNVTDMTDIIYTVTIIRLDKIYATVSDDGKSFSVMAPDSSTGDVVILALFDGERLVEAKKAIFDGGIVPFSTDKDYTTAKVIVLDSLSGMKPSCNYEIIE